MGNADHVCKGSKWVDSGGGLDQSVVHMDNER